VVQSNEKVFQNVYIPRTLEEIDSHEVDVANVIDGKDVDLVYQTVTGLNVAEAVRRKVVEFDLEDYSDDGFEKVEVVDIAEADCDEKDGSSEGSEESSDPDFTKRSNLKKDEDRDEKKERKNLVKEAKREKRKTKMPKAQKKRLTTSKR
jgi:RIO kinase 1